MPYKKVRLSDSLNKLAKYRAGMTPGEFATMVVKTFKDTYPNVAENLAEFQKAVDAAERDVKAKLAQLADVAKSLPSKPVLKGTLTRLCDEIGQAIQSAEAEERGCRDALSETMVNLDAQVEGFANANDESKAEGEKMKKFLGMVEPKITAQMNRIRTMAELQKKGRLVAETAIKKLDKDAKATAAELEKAMKELTEQLKVVKTKAGQVLGQSINVLELTEADYVKYEKEVAGAVKAKAMKPDRKKEITKNLDLLMKRTKRAFSDGQSSLDALDAAIDHLKALGKAALDASPPGGQQRVKAAIDKIAAEADQETKKVGVKAKDYLDDNFILRCLATQKELTKAMEKL